MRLLDLQPGELARVAEIIKGEKAQNRLYEIGLVPGALIEVISRHPFHGPLVLRLGNAEFALGRNLARMVEVERA